MNYPYKEDPAFFQTDGLVDYFFLCPEMIEDPEAFPIPNNWIFCDSDELAEAVVAFANHPPTDEQLSSFEWEDEVRAFVFESINDFLPEGFEILENGWISFVNPDRKDLDYTSVRALAGVVQWYVTNLTETMDFAADIVRKYSEN